MCVKFYTYAHMRPNIKRKKNNHKSKRQQRTSTLATILLWFLVFYVFFVEIFHFSFRVPFSICERDREWLQKIHTQHTIFIKLFIKKIQNNVLNLSIIIIKWLYAKLIWMILFRFNKCHTQMTPYKHAWTLSIGQPKWKFIWMKTKKKSKKKLNKETKSI